jgi:hypothetical protein
VSVLRLTVAGLVSLTIIPLATFSDEVGAWGQLASVMAVGFAVSLVLPHYFYRGEPLLPKRRQRD